VLLEVAAAAAALDSPSSRRRSSSYRSPSSLLPDSCLRVSFSPTSQAGIRHPPLPPAPRRGDGDDEGRKSALQAVPTAQPIAAGRSVVGNWDSASCTAMRYVVDLSERGSVRDGLLSLVVDIWYLNVCGTAAWYCANTAKIVAVGPDGR